MLLFMVNYLLASRYISVYIAHESNEKLHPLIVNTAMKIQVDQVPRATDAMMGVIQHIALREETQIHRYAEPSLCTPNLSLKPHVWTRLGSRSLEKL